MMWHSLIFLMTFAGMEFAAWSLHKYVMHGFLWSLHEDHHRPRKGYLFQYNDAFAVFFAVPSFLCILLGTYFLPATVATVGYGIMAYGFAYFFVHEVIIHRRLRFIPVKHWYFRALIRAHGQHHAVVSKEGCSNFGMLCVPLRYFREEWLAASEQEDAKKRSESKAR